MHRLFASNGSPGSKQNQVTRMAPRGSKESPQSPCSERSSPTLETPQPTKQHRASLENDRLCLNPFKVNNRRHSSELKTTLPKISISRAKSDIDIKVNAVNIKSGTENGIVSGGNAVLNTLAYTRVRNIVQLKDHNYQSVSKMLNLKSNKCRICSETIYFHGYECVQCKLIGHKKCLHSLYVKCPNRPMPPRLAIFGLEISDNTQVSEVLSVCIREIENRPIRKLKGIYQVEGNSNVVHQLCLSFEFGPHLIDLTSINVHDIASLVKEYLGKLSTPIFNKELRVELINIGKEWPVRKVPYTQSGLAILIFELRRLMSYLSSPYRDNLTFLMYHFKRIVDKQNIIEMSANALAVAFANIIFPIDPDTKIGHATDIENKSNDCSLFLTKLQQQHHHKQQHSNSNTPTPSTTPTDVHQYMVEQCNNTVTSSHHHVVIALDMPFQIRALELMITYAKEIFADQ